MSSARDTTKTFDGQGNTWLEWDSGRIQVIDRMNQVTDQAAYLLDRHLKIHSLDTVYPLPDSYAESGRRELEEEGLIDDGELVRDIPLSGIVEVLEEGYHTAERVDTPSVGDPELVRESHDILEDEGEIGYWDFVGELTRRLEEEYSVEDSFQRLEYAGKAIELMEPLMHGDIREETFRYE